MQAHPIGLALSSDRGDNEEASVDSLSLNCLPGGYVDRCAEPT
jgi:hypothetical protein